MATICVIHRPCSFGFHAIGSTSIWVVVLQEPSLNELELEIRYRPGSVKYNVDAWSWTLLSRNDP